MNSDIRTLLTAIATWRKAYKKLTKAVPDPLSAEINIHDAQAQVHSLLHKPSNLNQLDQLLESSLPSLTAAPKQLQVQVNQQQAAIATTEIESARPLNLSHKQMAAIIHAYLQASDETSLMTSSDDLVDLFPKLHAAIVNQVSDTRQMPRKAKKRRKRDITTGATFTAIGFGLLAANTQVEPAIGVYSYILGGNALMQAIRDLIGEKIN